MYNKVIRRKLKERLLKLDNRQFKLFYGMLVHYWVKNKYFISDHNFLNLWCELNKLCSEVDESFPDPYDDCELLKSYCQAHPYYFIDILEPELIADLFCEYLDDRLDVLATIEYIAQVEHPDRFELNSRNAQVEQWRRRG